MEGKKVALIDVDGEETARKIVEVALVNQLTRHGSFILANKKEVQDAASAPDLKPGDWKSLAERVGADYALRARVLKFDADTSEGYSRVKEYDSQIAAEQGSDHGEVERLYKVKALRGDIQVELSFTDAKTGEVRTGVAEAQKEVQAEAKNSSAHLPPKLGFLESLSNEAFQRFFEKYKN